MPLRHMQLLPTPTHAAAARRLSLLGLLAVLVALGCQRREEIARYTVEKPPPIEPRAQPNPHRPDVVGDQQLAGDPTDRTLGAIVPLTPQGWFFKLSGPVDAVAAHEQEFSELLESVRFSDGKPDWTLPADWQRRPGNQIRYATLVIPGEGKPLEVSVTALPNSGTDDENYILANINRWRRQLRLPPIDGAALAGESTQIELDGATATQVNLVGHAAQGNMGRPPFFPGARDGN